jgi:hypothetical protein
MAGLLGKIGNANRFFRRHVAAVGLRFSLRCSGVKDWQVVFDFPIALVMQELISA